MRRMKREKPIHSAAELPIEFIQMIKIASGSESGNRALA
jgi:hypothetical protein